MKYSGIRLLRLILTTGLLIINKPTVTFSAAWLTPPSHSSWYLSTFSPTTIQEDSSSELDTASISIPPSARPDILTDPIGILGNSITQHHAVNQQTWLTSIYGEIGLHNDATLLVDLSISDIKETHRLSYDSNIGTVGALIENDYTLLKPDISLLRPLLQEPQLHLTYDIGMALPPLRFRHVDKQFLWQLQTGELHSGIYAGLSFPVMNRPSYLEWGLQWHQPLTTDLGGIEEQLAFGQTLNRKWSWEIAGRLQWHMPNWSFNDFSPHELTEAASTLNYYGIPLTVSDNTQYLPYNEFSTMLSLIKDQNSKHNPSRKKQFSLIARYNPDNSHFSTGVMTCLWFQF